MIPKKSSFEMFVASRLIRPDKERFSGPIILISILSLLLGLAVMIISVVVLTGFKKEIQDKISGFTGHIHIVNYDLNRSIELLPINMDSLDLEEIKQTPGVKHTQRFISKAAILRTQEEIHGLMVKGVDADFDTTFYSQNLWEGRMPKFFGSEKTTEVMVSKTMAKMLKLHLNDNLRVYFVNNETGKIRARRFLVVGIYHTSVEEFDERLMIADIRHLQKVNNWQDNQVSGLEVFVDDFDKLDQTASELYEKIPYSFTTQTVNDRYPQIFDWLQLQDMNVVVILVLILLVASISMISTLLVLILERTQLIGLMKAMGARNSLLRKIFLWQAAYIVGFGMLLGNALGLGLAWLQKYYGLIKLDAGTYYMSVVPVNIEFWPIFLLNAATLLLVMLFMFIPVWVVSSISPIKAIRFD
ncbi:MAG: hypothetical protein B7C24_06195 [Bacteroidetes bacterium 4572_77]|nr:MAG: hypothetical protein B7C24_06195 [Bacteroidetes bacterium 4572_77]